MRTGKIAMCLMMAAVLLGAGCSGKKAGGNKFELYTSAVHKFSVEVPSSHKNFETQTRDTTTSSGNTVTTTMYQSASKDMIFMIAATPVNIESANEKKALEAGRDAVGKTGAVISKGEGVLSGKPALTLRYKAVSQGMDVFYSGVFAYINGTQYQVLFGSTDEKKLDGPEAKRFFESFKALSAEEAAANEKAAAPAAGEPAGEFTFDALCGKLVAETKASLGSAFTADMENQTKSGCMAASDAYKSSPKAAEALTAFTKHILTACNGKAGKDWLACYGNESAAAGQAAATAALK